MLTYTCELLKGTTKHRADIEARFPSEAAERFCQALVDAGDFSFNDREVVDVRVTISRHTILCHVTVSKQVKVEHTFTAMEST